MAIELNAGQYKRGHLFFIDPNEVIITEELRGRHKPPSEEDIIDMAVSLLEHGQQQPVVCRRVDDKRVKLHAGFTRANAARLIRSGFTDPEGTHRQDESFMLQCLVADCNDEEAFVRNVVENAHRNQTSPIDDAHNQRRLREQHGKSDEEIARLYRYRDTSKVTRLRELLSLDRAIQDLIHDGHMTVEAALLAKKLPKAKQAKAIKAATDESGKVNTSEIKSQVREEHLRDEPGEGKPRAAAQTAPKVGRVALTLKDVKDFFHDLANDNDARLAAFAGKFLDWLRGDASDRTFSNALDKLAGPKAES